MKHLIILTVLLATPAFGQSYDYIVQSQISANAADIQSQHENAELQNQQIRDDMARMRSEMAEQRLQNAIDNANARDEAAYH